jgi:hypothetical protein
VADEDPVTRALLGTASAGMDERALAKVFCESCVEGRDVDGASLSVSTISDSRETLWATDPTADLLEELQFSLNEGACMEAALTGSPVLVPDLRHDTETARWPLFAAAVMERTAAGALFALPLQWGTVSVGVLDLYRVAPGGLSAGQHRDVLGAVEIATLMMLGLRTDPDRSGGWLDPAVGHRAEIHQATGMVLAQLGIPATDALARLRGYAFAHQRLLIDVAHDVIERTLVFGPDMS